MFIYLSPAASYPFPLPYLAHCRLHPHQPHIHIPHGATYFARWILLSGHLHWSASLGTEMVAWRLAIWSSGMVGTY